MTGMHYFADNAREWDRVRDGLYDSFDVILCGKSTTVDAIARLQEALPAATVGQYFMTLFELSPNEIKSYPGEMSDRTTGVGRVIGALDDACVQWYADRAKACVGTAGILMCDNADPRQLPGYTRQEWDSLAGSKRRENFWEYAPKTMAAIRDAINVDGTDDVALVANVGHTLNPMTVSNPALRACYDAYCRAVNGIGIEKKTGSTVAFYTAASFIGPYAAPRRSIAFAQDRTAWEQTDAMALPQNVVKSCVGWVVKTAGV